MHRKMHAVCSILERIHSARENNPKNKRESIKKYYCPKVNTKVSTFKTTGLINLYELWEWSSNSAGAGEMAHITQVKCDQMELCLHPCDVAVGYKGYVSYDQWTEEKSSIRNDEKHGYSNFLIMIKKKITTNGKIELNEYVSVI